MTKRIVIIVESSADFRHVTGLLDRKILHHAPTGFDARRLAVTREWRGLEKGSEFTVWKDIKRLAKNETGLRGRGPIGFRRDEDRSHDYPSTRKVLQVCAAMEPRPDAVILFRDLDDQPKERRRSIEKAKEESPVRDVEIVLALAETKREAWLLNGFEARTKQEKTRLDALRKELGFHPLEQAHRLDATSPGAKRDAKRVLKAVTDGDAGREEECWAKTDWKILRERGCATGLHAFLEDAKKLLLPLIFG
jgi:hypothetical protein